jgi:hypothetical protein
VDWITDQVGPTARGRSTWAVSSRAVQVVQEMNASFRYLEFVEVVADVAVKVGPS